MNGKKYSREEVEGCGNFILIPDCTLLSPLPAEPPEVFSLALPLHSRLASLSLLRSSLSRGTFHIEITNKYITLNLGRGESTKKKENITLERFFLTPNNIQFLYKLYHMYMYDIT